VKDEVGEIIRVFGLTLGSNRIDERRKERKEANTRLDKHETQGRVRCARVVWRMLNTEEHERITKMK
jgi:hypothetical protein